MVSQFQPPWMLVYCFAGFVKISPFVWPNWAWVHHPKKSRSGISWMGWNCPPRSQLLGQLGNFPSETFIFHNLLPSFFFLFFPGLPFYLNFPQQPLTPSFFLLDLLPLWQMRSFHSPSFIILFCCFWFRNHEFSAKGELPHFLFFVFLFCCFWVPMAPSSSLNKEGAWAPFFRLVTHLMSYKLSNGKVRRFLYFAGFWCYINPHHNHDLLTPNSLQSFLIGQDKPQIDHPHLGIV
jgi:hypothetical protein